MNRRWIPLFRSTVAIIAVLSLALVLVHWHQERAGQDCGLCHAHQLPSLATAAGPVLPLPKILESQLTGTERDLVSSAFTPSHPGRAPPKSLSSIFG